MHICLDDDHACSDKPFGIYVIYILYYWTFLYMWVFSCHKYSGNGDEGLKIILETKTYHSIPKTKYLFLSCILTLMYFFLCKDNCSCQFKCVYEVFSKVSGRNLYIQKLKCRRNKRALFFLLVPLVFNTEFSIRQYFYVAILNYFGLL